MSHRRAHILTGAVRTAVMARSVRCPGGNIRCLNGYGGKFSRCTPTTGPSVVYPPRAQGGYGTFIRPYYPRYTYPYPYTYPTPEPPVAQPAPQEPAPTAVRHAPKPQEPVPTAARHPPKPPAPSKPPPPAAVVKHEAPPPPLPRIQSATPCLRDVNAAKYFAGGNDDSKSFQSVKRRIAFFAFDDPYNTGLGEIISSLLPKTIVCPTTGSGVAVISYAEGAAQDNSRHVAYFDKVDGVLKDQGFPFAVWGWITRTARRRSRRFLHPGSDDFQRRAFRAGCFPAEGDGRRAPNRRSEARPDHAAERRLGRRGRKKYRMGGRGIRQTAQGAERSVAAGHGPVKGQVFQSG